MQQRPRWGRAWTGLGLLLLAAAGMLLHTPEAAAQVTPDTLGAERDVEAALEGLDDETDDAAQLAELLAHLLEHPLDLNTATAAALAQVPALTPLIAYHVIRFRDRAGPFRSIDELTQVDGVTEAVLHRARPYLTTGATEPASPHRLHSVLHDLRYEMIQRTGRRLDLGRGYQADTTRAYPGSPELLYTRLRVRGRHVHLNLTLEKDPGERFTWDPATSTYFYDHLTASAALRDAGPIQQLVLGDFVADVGQGVVLWRSSGFGKGREPVRSPVRFGNGITPYGSTDENRFFRGLAGTVLLTPGLTLTAFASRRTLDATLRQPEAAGEEAPTPQVTSLSSSGLHRLPGEVDSKDALGENVYGGTLAYARGRAHLGLVGYRSRFGEPLQTPSQPYRHYAFTGQEAAMAGVYGHVFLGDLLLFGEAARDLDGTLGGTGGVQVQLSRLAEGLLLARAYPADFVSLHGYAFGERNGATQNETGVYTGLRLHPGPAWTLSAYFDQYRFPWLRFGVPRPSSGHDALLLVEHQPRRWLLVYLQARTETRETGTTLQDARGLALPALQPETRRSLRLHGDYLFSPHLRLRARVEFVRFTEPYYRAALHGLLLYQDVRWLPLQRVQLDLRLAFFDTDDYAARVYAYEGDLLYTFSAPAFTGRGQRSYLLLKYTPLKQLTLQLKYAMTRYEDVRTVGTGRDEVDGNRLREVRAQVRWRF